jgi:hypothetical protein
LTPYRDILERPYQFQAFDNLKTQVNKKRLWVLTPVFGIASFVILYFVATFYYPGGSQFDKNSIGFSWKDNYWCNLLNDEAINGQSNSAQPIALIAMFILCVTLAIFWLQFPKYTNLSKTYKLTIQINGILAMLIGLFLFTKFDHDLITKLASLFGLIATTGTLIGLFKNGWKTLSYFGLLNILLVIANNILYYNKELICYLPIVQKITFLTFLIWICSIGLKIFGLKNEKPPLSRSF